MRLSHLGALGLALLVFAVPAWGITVEEIVQLTKAGVADDVIVAQIRSDGTEFLLSARDILDLKSAGVSDKVLLAMIESRRPAPPPPKPRQEVHPAVDRVDPSVQGEDRTRVVVREVPTYTVYYTVPSYVYYPSYTYWPSYRSYARYAYGCGPEYSRGYDPSYRTGWGWPGYGFSYRHHGKRHSWGFSFGYGGYYGGCGR